MNDMVERVAREICMTCDGRAPDYNGGSAHPLGQYLDDGEPWWTGYTDTARAAIEAMREPTLEMKLAGAPAITAQMPRVGIQADYDAAHDSWIAMIDAALSPACTTGESGE